MELVWFPEKFMNPDKIDGDHAIIVLNRPVIGDPDLIKALWEKAALKLTVDGGTDRWINFLRENELLDKLKKPDFITGDFDSVSAKGLAHYEKLGSKIIKTYDQNETDFTKCLRVVIPLIDEYKISKILVLADSSGRLDQIMANINTLFKVGSLIDNSKSVPPIILMSSNSLSWLLLEGSHTIHIPNSVHERWCALVPIGKKATVSTKGLKWNLDNTLLEFGGLVSTSNTYDRNIFPGVVEITTDSPLLWSMGTTLINDPYK